MPMTFDDVRAFLLALPGVREGTSYGTPSFRTTKRLLARLKAVLVRLSTVAAATLKRLLLQARRESAPKTAAAAYDAGAHG